MIFLIETPFSESQKLFPLNINTTYSYMLLTKHFNLKHKTKPTKILFNKKETALHSTRHSTIPQPLLYQNKLYSRINVKFYHYYLQLPAKDLHIQNKVPHFSKNTPFFKEKQYIDNQLVRNIQIELYLNLC